MALITLRVDDEPTLTSWKSSRLLRLLANPLPRNYCLLHESNTSCLDHDYHDRQRRVVRSAVSQ